MKKLRWSLFFGFCLHISAQAEVSANAKVPLASPSLLYRFFSHRIFNLDDLLKQQLNLNPLHCTFTSPQKTSETYEGFGACVYENLLSALKTNTDAGLITAEMESTLTHKKSEMTVDWEPARGGYFKALQRLIYFYSTGGRPPGVKDSFLGFIALNFEKNPHFLEDLLPVGAPLWPMIQGEIEQVVLSFKANDSDPKTTTDLTVLYYIKNQKSPIYHMDITTDYSPLSNRHKIKFDLEASE